MKFNTNLLVASLAAGVLADVPNLVERDPPTLVERDLATVTSVIAQVDTGIKGLTSAVSGFSGDVSPLTSAATGLVSTLNSGTAAVQASTDLTLGDALNLQSIVTGLQADGQTLVNALTAKKAAFEQAGLCDAVRQQVADINTGSKGLIDAVVAKVPAAAQAIAATLAAGVTDTLAQGQAAFAVGNCTNASSGGNGSGSGSSATSTTSPSASPSGSRPPTTASAKTTSTSRSASGSGSFVYTPTTTTTSAKTTTSSPVQFTGAAAMNKLAAPAGALAFVAAAFIL